MKKLSAFLDIHLSQDVEITNLVLDSRQVAKDTLFVAIQGHSVDGREFIATAIENGAAAVLSETNIAAEHLQVSFINHAPVIQFYELSKQLSAIAGRFYDEPSKKLTLIGVTGTNGKTTVSQLLAQWALLLGNTAAVMGTTGNGLVGQLEEAKNTTGSAIEIQAKLADFLAKGANFAAIEVSSHGLVQNRVEALKFSAGVFTNLSRDHLDYHQTMDNYAQAKKRLFSELETGVRVLNVDDPIGKEWLASMPEAIEVSLEPEYQAASKYWLKATSIRFTESGSVIEFSSSWGTGVFHSALIGKFNVANLLLAAATLLGLGYPLTRLTMTASRLHGVCGRMELIKEPGFPATLVDYAHTPDALEKALLAAREHCSGRLWCVFGCGGDRDRGKRPLMGKIANQLADFSIVTMDNPRTEEQDAIEADILQGITDMDRVAVIPHRQDAIEFAIDAAAADDVILIAGKGHEDYQIIGHKKQYFSDQKTVRNHLARRRESK